MSVCEGGREKENVVTHISCALCRARFENEALNIMYLHHCAGKLHVEEVINNLMCIYNLMLLCIRTTVYIIMSLCFSIVHEI